MFQLLAAIFLGSTLLLAGGLAFQAARVLFRMGWAARVWPVGAAAWCSSTVGGLGCTGASFSSQRAHMRRTPTLLRKARPTSYPGGAACAVSSLRETAASSATAAATCTLM